MKTLHLCVAVAWLSLTLAAAPPQAGQADADVALKAAMHKELVDGDLAGAIDEYKRLAARPGVSRAVAAKALLQMAQSYEKLGSPEARGAYERVSRDYVDQRAMADEARTRLAALVRPVTATASPARRLLIDHRATPPFYLKQTRDGRSGVRYNEQQRGFELIDIATRATRRLTTEGPAASEAGVGQELLSNDGRQLAAVVRLYATGSAEAIAPRPVSRIELRLFEVGGRGAGRVLGTWNPDVLNRFGVRTFAWSPRNDRIWLWIMNRDESAQIVSVDLSGKLETLKTLKWRDHSQHPSLSPDGRFVTYHDVTDRQSLSDIYVLATDGSREQRIEHAANDNKPMFMPDGSGVVFESDRRGVRDLWFVPIADGRPSGPARLVWRDVGAFGQVESFADNGALSYYFASNDFATYTVPLDFEGTRPAIGERTRLDPVLNEMNTGPAFSPDGRYLLHFRARGLRIVIRELANGRQREIPLGAQLGLYATADWCTAGDVAIVSGYVNGSGYTAYAVNVNDASVLRLPLDAPLSTVCVGDRDIVYVRWGNNKVNTVIRRSLDSGRESMLFTGDVRSIARSKDGTRLAFVIHEASGARLVTMPPEGGSVSSDLMKAGYVAEGQVPLIQNVTWMPDDRRLLVVRVDDEFAGAKEWVQRPLWVWDVPVDGSPARRLGLLPLSKIDGYFAGLPSISVHPDGKQLAYQSHEGYVEQTWSIDNLAQFIKANPGS